MENVGTENAETKSAKTQKRTKRADQGESRWVWEVCGPDLELFLEANTDKTLCLVSEYGEIRFRYVAHLTASMTKKASAWDQLRIIEYALKNKWISAYGMSRIAEILQFRIWKSGLDRLPLPWLKTFGPKTTADQREYAEVLSLMQLGTCYLPALARLLKGEEDALYTVVKVKVTPEPDYQFETVVSWLCFLVEGHKDPQLRRAHKQFRPHEKLADWPTYLDAWDRLTRFPTRRVAMARF